MPNAFPLYVYLSDCDCIIIGGGSYAAHSAETLIRFGARVTVISPTLCPALRELNKEGRIRYIPRKYFRGDCTPATLCVAATDLDAVNISVGEECRAKGIPVNLSSPASHSTFVFPVAVLREELTLSVAGRLHEEAGQTAVAALEAAADAIIAPESAEEPQPKPKKARKKVTQP